MKSLKDFATDCTKNEAAQIYERFESAANELRTELYKLSDNGLEPARSALNKLGYMFGVESLINY
jgi:hypothetical protein